MDRNDNGKTKRTKKKRAISYIMVIDVIGYNGSIKCLANLVNNSHDIAGKNCIHCAVLISQKETFATKISR